MKMLCAKFCKRVNLSAYYKVTTCVDDAMWKTRDEAVGFTQSSFSKGSSLDQELQVTMNLVS